MNKLQKFIAKVFRIETTINKINYNDPLKCENVCEGMEHDRLRKIIDNQLSMISKSSKVDIGTDKIATEIRFVPLGQEGLSGRIPKTSLYKTTIVISIEETEYED